MSTSDAFDQFWDAYPLRNAKKDARKAFAQAEGERHLGAILAALAWQRQTDQWRRGFIPLAATYLRGERWTDENPAAAVEHDPLYAQFERWQLAHAHDPSVKTVSFEQFKAYSLARKHA